jgi:4-deoxy-L-threo-5-hexosulose-uronate ketol-isomerase
MEIRFEQSPQAVSKMSTAELRESFLFEDLFSPGNITMHYSHYDRIILGVVTPTNNTIELLAPGELKSEYFLERREIGIINEGGNGTIEAAGKIYELNKLDCLYVGKGINSVNFSSVRADDPAVFYFVSAPAHAEYPTTLCKKENASPVDLGAAETGNMRTIFKYIHLQGIRSCQLVMGLTVLKTGSVWNSVPPHTHTRRSEAYFYFDLPEQHRVFHFMGQPAQTRHLVMKNYEAVISPPWSVHFGSGTTNYGFIWAMAGENQVFDDMDQAPLNILT